VSPGGGLDGAGGAGGGANDDRSGNDGTGVGDGAGGMGGSDRGQSNLSGVGGASTSDDRPGQFLPAPDHGSTHDGLDVAFAVGEWLWGVVQGGFNEQQTISQIIADALIGCIPIVGDITAGRDLVAVIKCFVDKPESRHEKLKWVEAVVLVFALIPVVGGAIKGVGKLLLKGVKTAAEHIEQLKKVVMFLSRIGHGNQLKWLKELNLLKYTAELKGKWAEITTRIEVVAEKVLQRLGHLLSDEMVRRLEQIKAGMIKLRELGERMIPDAVKDLNARLEKIQKHIYEGDWHLITDGKAFTREAEARIVETIQKDAGEYLAHAPYPKNHLRDFKAKPGWPDLRGEAFRSPDGAYEVIECMSGPIEARIIRGPKKLRRIVGEKNNPYGLFWVEAEKMPTSGKVWREKSAVLERWNEDGAYVELVLADGEELRVWHGLTASQADEQAASKLVGQTLEGGAEQLVVDFKFAPNKAVLEDVERRSGKLHREKTPWPGDDKNVNVPDRQVVAQTLDPHELEPKLTPIEGLGKALSTGFRASKTGRVGSRQSDGAQESQHD